MLLNKPRAYDVMDKHGLDNPNNIQSITRERAQFIAITFMRGF